MTVQVWKVLDYLQSDDVGHGASLEGSMSAVERELQQRLSRLGPAEKRQVLEYTRELGEPPRPGTPGEHSSGGSPRDG